MVALPSLPPALRPILAATLLLALAVPSFASTGAIRGRFVERGTRTPLAGVDVALRRAADSTVVAHAATDSAGAFVLDSLPLDRYVLRAALLGYQAHRRTDLGLTEVTSTVDLGDVELAVSPIAVKPVEVTTARATAIVASDRNIYLNKDLPASTATDLLRTLPELDVDIDDRVSLRGSSSVTIQINGRESPLKGDALTTFLRQLPASRIERIEVIANPSAKYDPEGAGGIVNLVTRDPLDLGWSGSAQLALGDRGRGPSTRVAWQQGRMTLQGGVSSYWNRLEYRNDDRRTNLLTQPPSAYRLSAENRRTNQFVSADGAFDFALDSRSTLFGTTTGWVSSGRADNLHGYWISDASQGISSRYDRTSDVHNDWRSGTATLGFHHVVEKSRKEWSVELRQTGTHSSSTSDAFEHHYAPVDSAGVVSLLDGNEGSRERSLQIDDTHPLGAKGKLEVGYRGSERRSASSNRLSVLSGEPGGGISDYVHREVFHSGYVTAGSTFGRLSLQAGVRGEAASTDFEVVPDAARYDHDYRSVFPSANAVWDFGKGRTTRLTYSKRIERPQAGFLNPVMLSLDPLNRFAGNPELDPKYTHSFSLEASWTGSRGLLRLSPYYRETVDNWDQFKTVDSLGAAVTTWRNASSIRYLGASIATSLRQTGRIGGSLNASVYREDHDARNLSLLARRDATHWSVDGNLTFKATRTLDLQGWLRYSPAQTLAQGRISAILFSSLGARLKLGEKGWASPAVNDPFELWEYTFTTSDPTHVQTSTNRGSIRRTSLTFGWSWGKPPEAKTRRPAEDPQRPDPPVQLH